MPTKLRSLELGVQVGSADNWGRMSLPRRQPAAAARRRSGRRLRARVRRSAHRSRGAGPPAQPAQVDPRRGRRPVQRGCRRRLGSRRSAAAGRAPDRGARDRDAADDRHRGRQPGLPRSAPSRPVAARSNDAFPAVGALQMDLLAMALACDITRVASLQWSRSVSQHPVLLARHQRGAPRAVAPARQRARGASTS